MKNRIGIVGGGQLGRMMAFDAKKLGFIVNIIDPTPNSPAGQVADEQIVADYKNEDAILQLSKVSDFITFEIELANAKALNDLMKKGFAINPSPLTLAMIKDKLKQKEFLQKNKMPIAKFLNISSGNDILEAIKRFQFPLMLKTRTGGYDGRGNFVINKISDTEKGLEKLKGKDLYVEKFINFSKELAVMVARNIKGDIKIYPVAETIHTNNICDTVIVPPKISKKIYTKAQSLARRVVNKIDGAGVFGIEMFLTLNNNILVNEIAPRVHNSGHYTIEGCITSQFEQHIRAITNLPLGSTDLVSKAIVMKNILGEKNGNGIPLGIEKALQIKNVSIHIYGKKESRPERKMGHITVVGENIDECLRKVNKARRMIVI